MAPRVSKPSKADGEIVDEPVADLPQWLIGGNLPGSGRTSIPKLSGKAIAREGEDPEGDQCPAFCLQCGNLGTKGCPTPSLCFE